MQHHKELDSLRAFAIFFVMVAHWTPYGSLGDLSLGALGVEIFFCLSGFLMTLILLKARDRVTEQGGLKVLGNFYLRRILRIFPVYYCALFILLLLTPLFGSALKEHFPSFLLFSSNFYLYSLGHWEPMISHFWSLAVEIQFYLIWPLLLLFLPRAWLRPLFFLGILMGVIARAVLFYSELPDGHLPELLLILPQTCIDLFCFGALTASYFLEKANFARSPWRFLPLALGMALLGLVEFFDLPGLIFYRSIVGLLMIFVLGFCLKNPRGLPGAFLRWSPLVVIGQISYGLYIYHNLAEFAVLRFFNPGPLALVFMFFLVMGMAGLSWILLEGPINRLRVKLR